MTDKCWICDEEHCHHASITLTENERRLILKLEDQRYTIENLKKELKEAEKDAEFVRSWRKEIEQK